MEGIKLKMKKKKCKKCFTELICVAPAIYYELYNCPTCGRDIIIRTDYAKSKNI